MIAAASRAMLDGGGELVEFLTHEIRIQSKRHPEAQTGLTVPGAHWLLHASGTVPLSTARSRSNISSSASITTRSRASPRRSGKSTAWISALART
jgi:hypothetical protein